jgi:small-conductance mechanosensitive channel
MAEAAASPASQNSSASGAEPTTDTQVQPLISETLPHFEDWLPEAALPAWQALDQYPWLSALVLVGVFYIVAWVARWAVGSALLPITRLSASIVDDLLVGYVRKPVFTTIFLAGCVFAVNVSGIEFGRHLLVSLLMSVIVVSWMSAAFKISILLLDRAGAMSRFRLVETRTAPLFGLTAKLLIILFGSYVLLLIWGINPVGWLASAGIVGIAVGFAAKDTLANLFSGFFIVADTPYQIGDYINLDSGERGRVSAIGLRSTRIVTRDDVEIIVPNGVIANAKIVNESGGPDVKIRVRLVVGVAYGSDVDELCTLLKSLAEAHPEACQDPEPRVRMRGFGASSLDFELLLWIDHPQDRGRISHEMYMQIYKSLNENGFEIPFTKTDLYIKEFPANSS